MKTIICHPQMAALLLKADPDAEKYIKILRSDLMTEPRRTHKRKRIFKKWAKLYRRPSRAYHVMDNPHITLRPTQWGNLL